MVLPGRLSIAETLGKAVTPPTSLAVQKAIELLEGMGALTIRRTVGEKNFLPPVHERVEDPENLTSLGRKLASLPLHPRLGKMLLLGCLLCPQALPVLLSTCATLSFKSPFVSPMGKEGEATYFRDMYARGTSFIALQFPVQFCTKGIQERV